MPPARPLTEHEAKTYQAVLDEVCPELLRDLTRAEDQWVRRQVIKGEWPAEWIVAELLNQQ